MELEHALVLEQESHAAAVTQRTAATTEVHADIGHRAVGVVRRRFHHDRDAVRTVSFVNHLLVVGRILLRGTLDRTFDILLGHVLRLGVLNQDAQAGVGGRIGAADLTAISISLPILVNTRAMCPQRFNLRALRYSNALPIVFYIFSMIQRL